MDCVYILPTGDEIKNGIVLDLDSPEIMRQILAVYPAASIVRLTPVLDIEDSIFQEVQRTVEKGSDLLVLIGGSGGGHRFSGTLGKDFTHTALERYLSDYAEHSVYGKNGHMWTRLLCGRKNNTVIINVPGPFEEAKAAFSAYMAGEGQGKGLDEISRMMAQAVYEKYPAGAADPI